MHGKVILIKLFTQVTILFVMHNQSVAKYDQSAKRRLISCSICCYFILKNKSQQKDIYKKGSSSACNRLAVTQTEM